MVSRLGEVMLYISKRCSTDESFGSTKLNKLLFVADFMAFGVWGEPLTEATYMHWERGPIPKQRPGVEDELIESGRARVETVKYFGYLQKRLVAIDEPDLTWMSPEKRQFLDQVIDHLDNLNATQLSDWSHSLLPWLYTKQGEDIPYTTVFCLARREPGFEDIEWAKSTIQALREEGSWPMSPAR